MLNVRLVTFSPLAAILLFEAFRILWILLAASEQPGQAAFARFWRVATYPTAVLWIGMYYWLKAMDRRRARRSCRSELPSA
ncbi:MAG: hypothetical protein A3A44_01775 [Candidatus Sungbacteria bacterium RIFCSPLOWO2_01_FULL_60_25]|uniref:Uncharacterized protein n=1 Tax=Candidatus Sungbacteria bacterium RIFCSPLOWO2_01_FULL_60_25 TaxID=1802281 RepID=A0A1G2LAU1_9BACT|nr:MAG: hypothetical protein A3A44_01775 [Candidatus Sungbacteria bacterium RIFCSPLOWO2_01_FULL_60_25]